MYESQGSMVLVCGTQRAEQKYGGSRLVHATNRRKEDCYRVGEVDREMEFTMIRRVRMARKRLEIAREREAKALAKDRAATDAYITLNPEAPEDDVWV